MVSPLSLSNPSKGTIKGQITGVLLMGDNQVKNLILPPEFGLMKENGATDHTKYVPEYASIIYTVWDIDERFL